MSRFSVFSLIIFLSFIVFTPRVYSGELSGNVSVEARLFTESPSSTSPITYDSQDRHNTSVALTPEYYSETSSGAVTFTFTPFLRLDSADNNRTHFDVRELFFLKVFDEWEIGFGIRKFFWGVTESAHLVDIINQVDLVESSGGEDKLGQPMINIAVEKDFGNFDFFLMPFFRERTFPGEGGRLRPPLVVDADLTEYQSKSEEQHVDFALRYSHYFGNWELGLSYFYGTGREPLLRAGLDDLGNPILIPRYIIINQGGLELQRNAGDFIFKFEGIYRDLGSEGEEFFSTVLGLEYTLVGLFESDADLGLIAEWLYDDRGENSQSLMEDDIMIGLRLALNDVSGTEALLGVVEDLDSGSGFIFLESSRRFGDNIRASIEASIYSNALRDEPLSTLAGEDHIRLELFYFF
ncbi:MAG: hypothetical protein KAT46_06880 [Deltaproteobacteria bacterium]|nr:hypothetical protein [Deltaproteobacteria bacterium]